jgi:hypothetical protein
MADENQELQRMAEELRNSFQGLDAATKNANVGLAAFGKELKTVPGQLIKGMGGLAASVAKGDTSLKSMNAVVDVAANAISGLAKTVPIFGEALSAATKAVAEGAKIVVEQLDATAKTFNAMSASGAAAADGMTGLSRQFQTAGLSMQQFQKVVGQNSMALARFRGIAGDGAEEFSKAVGNLTQKQDTDLRKIGMSAEDISATTAAFVTQQTRLGKSQEMSTSQLTAGAKNYALELDQLSKVTGLSREAIQKQQDAALSEGRFRAVTDELVNSGKEKEAAALMNLQTRMQSFDAELGQGIRDLSSGMTTTEAARKMVVSTGGAATDIIRRMTDEGLSASDAQKELQDAYKRMAPTIRQNAKALGDSNDAINKYSAVSDFNSANIEGNGMKAAKTQSDQINKTDKLTQETIEAQQNLEKFNVKMSVMALKLMPAAAWSINQMTASMNALVDWVEEKIGGANGGTHGGSKATTNASGGGAAGVAVTGEVDLSAQGGPPEGLKIKSAESTAGGGVKPGLYDLAEMIQSRLGGGLKYFSAFNDAYHMDRNSNHNKGTALDFTLMDPNQAATVSTMVQGMPGVSKVINEYANPSMGATAGHIHAEISAANGAILSGPTGGYRPNLTMHGTEAIVPLNSPAAQSMGLGGGENTGLMAAQLEKLEEMVSVMKNQLDVSRKIMQYAS